MRLVARGLSAQLSELTVAPWQEVEATFYRTMQADKQGNYFTMGSDYIYRFYWRT